MTLDEVRKAANGAYDAWPDDILRSKFSAKYPGVLTDGPADITTQRQQIGLQSDQIQLQNQSNTLNDTNTRRNFTFSGDYNKDLTRAAQLGISKDYVTTYYQPQLDARTAQNKKKQEDLKAAEAKAIIKAEIVSNAQKLAAVIEAKRQGKYKSDAEYKSAYKFAASNYAASRGFAEGGKALTGPELAQLAGSMPRTKQQGPYQRLMGIPPSGELADSEEEVYRKSLLAMQNSGNKKFVDHANKMLGQTQTKQGFHGNIVENAANEIAGMGKSVGNYLTTPHPNQTLDITDWSKDNPVKMAAGMLPEIGKSALRTAGFGVKSDGTISWSPVDIVKHAWNQPIETLLWVLPIKGKIGDVKGTLPKIGKSAASAGKKGIVNTLEVTTGGGTKDLIAQNVLKDRAEELNKTLVDHNIYKYTDKGRIEATQKALIDEGLNLEKKYANSNFSINSSIIDKQIDDIIAHNGITDPTISTQIRNALQTSGVYDLSSNTNTFTATDIWNMAKRGSEFGPKAFNIPTIGPQAKAITSDLTRYFRGLLAENVPEATPNLRSYANLRTYMDDILKDPEGVKVNGVMSIMNVLANLANSVVGRPLQVGSQQIYNQLNKISPEIQTSAPSASLNTLPPIESVPAQGAARQPLPAVEMNQIVQNMKNIKPAQTNRLLRDMRYKQGNFQPRKQQDKVLRKSKRVKYK